MDNSESKSLSQDVGPSQQTGSILPKEDNIDKVQHPEEDIGDLTFSDEDYPNGKLGLLAYISRDSIAYSDELMEYHSNVEDEGCSPLPPIEDYLADDALCSTITPSQETAQTEVVLQNQLDELAPEISREGSHEYLATEEQIEIARDENQEEPWFFYLPEIENLLETCCTERMLKNMICRTCYEVCCHICWSAHHHTHEPPSVPAQVYARGSEPVICFQDLEQWSDVDMRRQLQKIKVIQHKGRSTIFIKPQLLSFIKKKVRDPVIPRCKYCSNVINTNATVCSLKCFIAEIKEQNV